MYDSCWMLDLEGQLVSQTVCVFYNQMCRLKTDIKIISASHRCENFVFLVPSDDFSV